MAEQPEKEKGVTQKGAVEVDEKDLDRAAGGMSSGGDYTESVSLNYGKTDTSLVDEKDLAGGGGPHIAPESPEKKLT